MEVSFTTAAEEMANLNDKMKDLNGYSHASYQISQAFSRAGIDVKIGRVSSPVGISMGFPSQYRFTPNQYKIGYTAWESTELIQLKEKEKKCLDFFTLESHRLEKMDRWLWRRLQNCLEMIQIIN